MSGRNNHGAKDTSAAVMGTMGDNQAIVFLQIIMSGVVSEFGQIKY